MKDSSPSREVEALIQAYLEGSLTESEAAQLLIHLRQDPTLAVEIVDDLRFDCLIRVVVAEGGVVQTPSSGAKFLAASFPKTAPARPVAGPEFGTKWVWPLALAASIILLVSLGFWFLGPAMGEPVLAEIQGDGVSVERAKALVQVTAGMRLQPGDVIRAGTRASATIRFDPESTQIRLDSESELQLVALRARKQLAFRSGRLEAAVARQRPFRPLTIATPNAEAKVLGTRFSLTVSNQVTRLEVAEGRVGLTDLSDGHVVKVSGGQYSEVAKGTVRAALPLTGAILREWWNGVSWEFPWDAIDDPRFPNQPDGAALADRFEFEPVRTNHFGVRLRGYVHPPVTGDYEFWLATTDRGQMFLSPSEDAGRKVLIAISASGVKPRDWDAVPGPDESSRQHSEVIRLEAGKRYYVEAFATQPRGEMHLSVAWKRPGALREIITRDFLSPPAQKK